ncbi:MAG: hypothetical protein ABEJ83_05690 [Candidatus Nanohaloarchaea archaeon]
MNQTSTRKDSSSPAESGKNDVKMTENEFGRFKCPNCYSEMEEIGIEGDAAVYGCKECDYTNQPNDPTGVLP